MGDGSLSLRRGGLETGPTVQDPARPVERCEVEREGCEVTEEPTSGAADCREGFWEVGGRASAESWAQPGTASKWKAPRRMQPHAWEALSLTLEEENHSP